MNLRICNVTLNITIYGDVHFDVLNDSYSGQVSWTKYSREINPILHRLQCQPLLHKGERNGQIPPPPP